MSLLTVLPRMTAWGSQQKFRDRQTRVDESKNLLLELTKNVQIIKDKESIEMRRSPIKKKRRRRRISYWSDEETNPTKPLR